MGVRFECPQGHKLHVKAHLAGQRGICPECGLRFIVPSFSGGRVSEAPAGDSSRSGFVNVSMESTASFNAALAATADDAAGDDSAAWYVRPAAGGQFGPIDTAGFRHWIDEGRVGADAWVWRTGWTDWRPGGDAVRSLAVARPRTPPPAPVASTISAGAVSEAGSLSSTGSNSSRRAPVAAAAKRPTPAHATPQRTGGRTPSATAIADSPSPIDEALTDAAKNVAIGATLDELFSAPRNGEQTALMPPVMGARAVRDKRRKYNQLLTIVLAVVALVLLVVLVLVMRRSNGAATRGGIESPLGSGGAPATAAASMTPG